MSVSMCAWGEVYVHVSELTGMADLQRRVGGRPRGSCTLPVRGLLSTPGQDVGIVPLRTAGGGTAGTWGAGAKAGQPWLYVHSVTLAV